MSRHHARTRERFAITDAMAMIGTASRGPNVNMSTGISMIDEPKPTTPPSVPAISPTVSTSTYSMHARRAKAASVAGRGEAAARHRETCAREGGLHIRAQAAARVYDGADAPDRTPR